MKCSAKWFLLPMLCAAVLASQGKAEVLFYDNFETDTAGLSGSTEDLDPVIGTGDVGGFWEPDESPETEIQVLNDAPIQSGVAGDNNYLKVDSANSKAKGWDRAKTENQLLELTCSVYVPAGNPSNKPGNIAGWDEVEGLRAFSVYFDAGGSLRFYDGGSWHNITSIGFTENEWFDVSILADMSAATYEFTVAGQTATEDLHWISGANQIDRLSIYASGGATIFYDNISLVQVPEPSSLVLLGGSLLGFALVGRRRWSL